MHGAPSVNYPVGRCRLAGALALAFFLLGGGALAAWARQSVVAPWVLAVASLLWLACGLAALAAWLRSPTGELRWTGTEWQFRGLPAAAPEVSLDLQRWLLVRLPTGPRAEWLWLEGGQSADWDALRRAVYSRASTTVPPAARPPVASP